MAAEDDGGGGPGRKFGPLPVWGWALVLGGIGGLVFFLRRSQSADKQTTTDTGTGTEAPDQTSIVPVNQGIGAEQAQQILDAIKALQGDLSKDEDDDDDKPPSKAPPPVKKPPVKKPPTKKERSIFIKAHHGDTYSSIAKRYHMSAAQLWAYQLKPGVRPAATQAELRRRGINHALFSGSGVAIPVAIPADKVSKRK